jgi:two-component system sensor histidine kinase RegB
MVIIAAGFAALVEPESSRIAARHRSPAIAPGVCMLAPAQLLSASRQNLWRLTLMRFLVLAAQASSVGLAYLFDLLPLPWLALSMTLGLSALLCLLSAVRLRQPWPVTELEYAAQLAGDLLIHSLLLYFSGGSTNPFVAYYLVSLTIAAATLPWLYSMVLSGLALSAYTVLLIWYHPLEVSLVQRETLLIYGMWLNFALSAAFITFFVVKMAGALRSQDQLRAERREESLRDQQLLAVATQAAGAAHELGTPLSTMSVLIKELRREHTNPLLQEDLVVLQEQVTLCKQTLQQLVRAAEADRRLKVEEQSAITWLETALNRWHLMRPEASYRYQRLGQGSTPRLAPSPDLTQALLNLLNNAADACPDKLDIRLEWDAFYLCISIHDHGAGVPLAIAEQLGKAFFTTKGKGFGLGLFLSQASVTRAGGSVKLYNHEDGGTRTELRLPRLAPGDEHE